VLLDENVAKPLDVSALPIDAMKEYSLDLPVTRRADSGLVDDHLRSACFALLHRPGILFCHPIPPSCMRRVVRYYPLTPLASPDTVAETHIVTGTRTR